MDNHRFDGLTKAFASGTSRRSVIKGLLGFGGTAAVATIAAAPAEARRGSGSRGSADPCDGQTVCGTFCCDSATEVCNAFQNGCCGEGTYACDTNSTGCCAVCDGFGCGYDCCAGEYQCCDGECCSDGYSCLALAFGCSDSSCEESCCPDNQTCGGGCCDGTCFDPYVGLTGFSRECCPAEATFCSASGDDVGYCCSGDTPFCCVRDGQPICLAEGQCCDDLDCPADACDGLTHTYNYCDPADNQCKPQTTDCDDGNECTSDVCDPAGGCSYANVENGAACGEGGMCQDGECVIPQCTADLETCSSNEECCSGACNCGDTQFCVLESFYQDFSSSADGWVGVTASGGVGLVPTGNGSFSRLGGYSSVFPGNGWVVSLDIYLDMSLATGSNDDSFDYSAAATRPNCDHRRDFIFSVGADPNSAGQFAISASNNSVGWPSDPNRNPLFVATTGWYTFTHAFADAGDGSLAVTMSVAGPGGNSSWVLNDTSDIIGSVVGGNRYAWFPYNALGTLQIDNSARYTI